MKSHWIVFHILLQEIILKNLSATAQLLEECRGEYNYTIPCHFAKYNPCKLSSVVELVKTSAPASRRSLVQIPPKNAFFFKFFIIGLRKALCIHCL